MFFCIVLFRAADFQIFLTKIAASFESLTIQNYLVYGYLGVVCCFQVIRISSFSLNTVPVCSYRSIITLKIEGTFGLTK